MPTGIFVNIFLMRVCAEVGWDHAEKTEPIGYRYHHSPLAAKLLSLARYFVAPHGMLVRSQPPSRMSQVVVPNVWWDHADSAASGTTEEPLMIRPHGQPQGTENYSALQTNH